MSKQDILNDIKAGLKAKDIAQKNNISIKVVYNYKCMQKKLENKNI